MKLTIAQVVSIIALALEAKDKQANHVREAYYESIRSKNADANDLDMAGKESRNADAVFGGVASVAMAVNNMIEANPTATAKDVHDLVWDMHCKASEAIREDSESSTYWKGSLNMHAYITASYVHDTCLRLHSAEHDGILHVYDAILYADNKLCGGNSNEDLDDDEIEAFETYAASIGI